MGEATVRLARATRRSDLPKDDDLHPHEESALEKLRAEAEKRGVSLASGGKGGLSPSLVLGVFRRDKFRCKSCASKKNLTVHHKGGIVESDWLSKKGHSNDPNNLTILCEPCHDRVHQEAKAEGIDSSQVTPEGDKGTRRDHGLPDAHPEK